MGEPTCFRPHCCADIGCAMTICRICSYDIVRPSNESSYVELLPAALRHPVSKSHPGILLSKRNEF